MKYWIVPILLYVFVYIIAVLIPASDSAYDIFSWKLMVAQIYSALLVIYSRVIAKRF